MSLPSIIPGVKRHRALSRPVEREASAKRVALEPSVSPFVPRVSSTPATEEDMINMSTYFTELDQRNQFDSSIYSSSPATRNGYSSELSRQLDEEDARVYTAPIDVQIIHRPAPNRYKFDNTFVTITNSSFSSDLPPSSLPPTPSLESVPQFSNHVGYFNQSSRNHIRVSARVPIPTPSELPIGASAQEENEYYNLRRTHRGRQPYQTRFPFGLVIKKSHKHKNPYISLRRTSGDERPSFLYRDLEKVKMVEASNRGETYEPIGKYRRAATWEIIGQTYEKKERLPGKKRDYKRFKHYAPGHFPKLAPTNLRNVETLEEDEDVEMDDLYMIM